MHRSTTGGGQPRPSVFRPSHAPEYTLYLNRHYFDTLATAEAFGNRPEPHRRHEKSLWTIYQLLKHGEHQLLITDPARQRWIAETP